MSKGNLCLDIIGERYGRLLVIEEDEPYYVLDKRDGKYYKRTTWVCECDCGNSKTIKLNSLRSRLTRSCGCLAREWSRAMNKKYGTINGIRQGEKTGYDLGKKYGPTFGKKALAKYLSENREKIILNAKKQGLKYGPIHGPINIKKYNERRKLNERTITTNC